LKFRKDQNQISDGRLYDPIRIANLRQDHPMPRRLRIITPAIESPELSPIAAYITAQSDADRIVEHRFLAQGPGSVSSYMDEVMAGPGMIAAAREAEAAGADGIVVNCMCDPALPAVREAVSIPVVGLAQSTMLAAAGLGQRFGYLDVLDSSRARACDALRRGSRRRSRGRAAQASVLQAVRPVGDRRRRVRVVRDDERRRVLRAHAPGDLRVGDRRRRGVERGGRFVEEIQRLREQERAGDEDAPSFAARQPVEAPPREMRGAERRERLVLVLPRASGGREHVAHGERKRRVDAVVLRQVGDASARDRKSVV
jgi:Asp/Glu/hydantoin racemase